jgi:hypothetical protein
MLALRAGLIAIRCRLLFKLPPLIKPVILTGFYQPKTLKIQRLNTILRHYCSLLKTAARLHYLLKLIN